MLRVVGAIYYIKIRLMLLTHVIQPKAAPIFCQWGNPWRKFCHLIQMTLTTTTPLSISFCVSHGTSRETSQVIYILLKGICILISSYPTERIIHMWTSHNWERHSCIYMRYNHPMNVVIMAVVQEDLFYPRLYRLYRLYRFISLLSQKPNLISHISHVTQSTSHVTQSTVSGLDHCYDCAAECHVMRQLALHHAYIAPLYTHGDGRWSHECGTCDQLRHRLKLEMQRETSPGRDAEIILCHVAQLIDEISDYEHDERVREGRSDLEEEAGSLADDNTAFTIWTSRLGRHTDDGNDSDDVTAVAAKEDAISGEVKKDATDVSRVVTKHDATPGVSEAELTLVVGALVADTGRTIAPHGRRLWHAVQTRFESNSVTAIECVRGLVVACDML